MTAEAPRAGFTLAERDRRWARLRALMAPQEMAFLVVLPDRQLPGDARYVALRLGAVVFPLEGEPTFLSPWTGRLTASNPWIADARPATATGTTAVPYGEAVGRRLRELDVGRRRVGLAGLSGTPLGPVRNPEGYAKHTAVEHIRAAVPQATLVDASALLAEARYVKSEEEIGALRRAVAAGEAGAPALAASARPGVTAAEAFGATILAQYRAGAEDTEVAWGGGPWGEAKERTTTVPPGVLQPGWAIKTEMFPSVLGYQAQIAQPVFVGPPPADAQALCELGQAAFERARAAMRPGATWCEVEEQARAVARGGAYEIEFLCHGRGLGDDGPMFIPMDDHTRHPLWEAPLLENTAFVLKPYAYRPDRGRDDWTNPKTVTWGDTVVVRAGGAERLGTRPYALLSSEG
ncbi:MAG TPA: M24 family metallopeptidase [Chloroflexota bacterium]|nr:M24 family metallopeptidase [Chloroflexota bacterium]